MALATHKAVAGGALANPHGISLEWMGRWVRSALCASAALVLVACATSDSRAPVEERHLSGRSASGAAGMGSEAPKPPPPGIENAGKPGYYTVRPGDTLVRVGLETGQHWKDLSRWNNLSNPDVLEVGQVIRVVPPGTEPSPVSTRGIASARVESRPLDAPNKPVTPAPAASGAVAAAPASTPAPSPSVSAPVTPGPNVSAAGEDDIRWVWPAQGTVIARFDEQRGKGEMHSKGLSIAGKIGDPIFAAADGKVVYAGSGLRGYGNLVILSHNNNSYLTAYAHNRALLVKEEQQVKRGQKIAEMGTTDTDRVRLHFEIRKLGKPLDPEKFLPAR